MIKPLFKYGYWWWLTVGILMFVIAVTMNPLQTEYQKIPLEDQYYKRHVLLIVKNLPLLN